MQHEQDMLSMYIGRYVRIETPSRFACGAQRSDGPCSVVSACCDWDVAFGCEMLVIDVLYEEVPHLMGDEGYSHPIEDDTTIMEVKRERQEGQASTSGAA